MENVIPPLSLGDCDALAFMLVLLQTTHFLSTLYLSENTPGGLPNLEMT